MDGDNHFHGLARFAALSLFVGFEPATIAEHANAVVQLLDEENFYARLRASELVAEALAKIEPHALAEHAGAVAARLENPCEFVHRAALEILDRLAPTVLAEHPGAVVAMLGDDDSYVRLTTIRKLQTIEPHDLAQYAGAVIERLADDDAHVHHDACELLERLEPAVLAQHAGSIVAMIERENAAESHVWEAVRTLPSAAIAEHATAIAAKLDDENPRVRGAALRALCGLDPVSLQAYFPAFFEAVIDRDDDVSLTAFNCIQCHIEVLAPAALVAAYDQLRAFNEDNTHESLCDLEDKFDSKMFDLGIGFDGGDY